MGAAIDLAGFDPAVALLGGLVVLGAAFLAGAVGFAHNLVALPLLLLVGLPLPDVVVVNLTVSALVRVVVVTRFRRDVDRRRAGGLVLAAVPGIAAGTLVLAVVPVPVLEVAAGITALVAVAAMTLLPTPAGPWEAGRGHVAAAGALGGFLGATTSLNGVPPALLLARARATATSTIADLAAYFLVGNAITLALLTAAGTGLRADLVPLLAAWAPIALVGNTLGVRFGRGLAPEAFRRLTLLVIVVSGVVSVARNL
jgi:uncharacterized membrane protein YfcA